MIGEMLPKQRDPLTEEEARVLELVASKMKLLLTNEDPNIKCLSLDLLSKLLLLRPELANLYSDTVLASLEEIDEKTRCLALDILCSMVYSCFESLFLKIMIILHTFFITRSIRTTLERLFND